MSRTLVVHKFGGAALADAAAIHAAARIVAARAATPVQQVVVASALAGVTDTLLELAERASSGDAPSARDTANRLAERHRVVANELEVLGTRTGPRQAKNAVFFAKAREAAEAAFDDVSRIADGLAALQELTPTVADTVVSRGERVSARFVVAALRALDVDAEYVDATDVLITDGQPGNAFPDLRRTATAANAVLLPILRRGAVAVVPGFIGGTAQEAARAASRRRATGGRAAIPSTSRSVVTLGRGGSDLTATSLGRALGATEILLWKDVPGLLTADPRIVESARVIRRMSASEASELAYNGAKVLHPRALIPLTVIVAGMPRSRSRVVLRPFAEPSAEGTMIEVTSKQRTASQDAVRYPVKAVSSIRDQALMTIRGTGMAGVPGIAARAFAALERVQVSVSLISQASSEQSITLGIQNSAVPLAQPVLREAFTRELARGELEDVQVRATVATVAVVGRGMAGRPGIAARVFAALADAKINVVAIAQASSELSISVVVDDVDAAQAVRALHHAFRLDRIGGGAAHAPAHADVVLLGLGKVGQELALQLAAARRAAGQGRAPFEVVGVIDSSGYVFAHHGLSPRALASLVRAKRAGRDVATQRGGRSGTAENALEQIAAHALSRPILVDVTGSDSVSLLGAAVGHGMDLVLANKRPIADGSPADDVLSVAAAHGRRVLHEATVGAGLPVIDTIHKLIESGDPVLRVEACPSGTLGFLFDEMGKGRTFSDSLTAATARGYTEPDPRDDLSGMDVARKAVILGRLIGWSGSLADVAVESLVPKRLRAITREQFVSRATELDEEWARRVQEARRRGKVLRYKADVTAKRVTVGVEEVDAASSFASLAGTDNQFVFTTRRYRERPLVITGPGAGPAVTAAGVLNDVLSLAGSR